MSGKKTFIISRTTTSLQDKLHFRISLSSMFRTTPELFDFDYGGDLLAYSLSATKAEDWFNQFRKLLLDSLGRKYLPVYRMADGEYQFLFGLKYNTHTQNKIRYFLSYSFRKSMEIISGQKIKTSWGETYKGVELLSLRKKYLEDLNNLLNNGVLCPYLYENPKYAFVHYNKYFLKFLNEKGYELNEGNFFPFHFPFFALTNEGWEDFIVNRNILIVTGALDSKKELIKRNLSELGARKIGFYQISSSSSMKDTIDINRLMDADEFEIAFVGAGIGSLNILSQMNWFQGPVIDVGGFIKALQDITYLYHGGAVKFPVKKEIIF